MPVLLFYSQSQYLLLTCHLPALSQCKLHEDGKVGGLVCRKIFRLGKSALQRFLPGLQAVLN